LLCSLILEALQQLLQLAVLVCLCNTPPAAAKQAMPLNLSCSSTLSMMMFLEDTGAI
jgi:hypothetical protein